MRPLRLKQIGYADILGGGQVNVRGDLCFVGHISPPEGTTILDVSDPANPLIVGRVLVPLSTHSHKVRARDGIMLVNNEAFPEFNVSPELQPGLRIFDISRPEEPREIAFFRTGGRGVHRFDYDGTFAYLSAEMDGFHGNIVVIVDLSDPVRPREVSRWWLPGQWVEGGEAPSWEGVRHRVHHPLRSGDRLYVGCCHAGMAIIDISDLADPKTITRHPLHGLFSHTVMPVETGAGDERRLVVAVDEGWWDEAGAFTVVDITNPARSEIVSTLDLPPGNGRGIWAPHQPHEEIIDGLMFVAWFSHGLRVIDVSRPTYPVEIARHMPQLRSEFGPLSNDVFVDGPNCRIYLLDRVRGLEILEYDA